MDPIKQCIAIAKRLGFPIVSDGISHHLTPCHLERKGPLKPTPEGKFLTTIPNYTICLDVMQDAWREYFGFYSEQWLDAYRTLKQVVADDLGVEDLDDPYLVAAVANSRAHQWAKAFLKHENLWEES